ncbi:MAG: cell division protein SepF, partial [Thermoplasmata archaeon]
RRNAAPPEGIGMGLFKPLKKLLDHGPVTEGEYVDLSELPDEGEAGPTKTMVRVVEVHQEEDLGLLNSLLYEGSVVVVDYSSIANDELALKRVTSELKAVARDTGGDVAALGRNFLLATPEGIKIDRTKVKNAY